MITRFNTLALLILLRMPVLSATAAGEVSDEEIAKKLNDPISNLISVPFQSNWDFKMGPRDEGTLFKLSLQPVIQVELSTLRGRYYADDRAVRPSGARDS
jgi:hypothetical protein